LPPKLADSGKNMYFWYFFLIALNWAYIITWPGWVCLAPLLWWLLIEVALVDDED